MLAMASFFPNFILAGIQTISRTLADDFYLLKLEFNIL